MESPPLQLDSLFDGNGPAAASVQAVLAHPRFIAMMRLTVEGWVGITPEDRQMNAIMTDRAHYILALFAVYLHHEAGDGDAPGLTPGRMKAHLAPRKLCSPGRVDAMLLALRSLGYLDVMPQPDDRRVRRLRPTDRLIEWHRRRCRLIFGGMAKVLDEGGEALAALDRPGFLDAFISRLSETYLRGNFYSGRLGEIRALAERKAGIATFLSLLLSGEAEDAFPPQRPVAVSLSLLARRFGVARAQMRRLFALAEAEGLIARDGDGEAWRILPRLDHVIRYLTAQHVVHNAHAVRLALQGASTGIAAAS